ncbi:G2/M phase-specific E3 ubiquitin-protein ligase-like isoform X1 [Drosophila rhopaloa]|uniref:Uncharacterized protein n=1 Tax=Drosophila rhopaloa TaxID=1041015 RepID=A0ABM5JB89_DRORH|nr:G2/M phase-specific E3 ubiquitin-protein ligase-like isoform X1 [Drosophila rhopaloa]
MEEQNKLKCDICDFSSGHTEEETLLYGDWMVRKDLRVHYFCLLLSSNLPQSGGDASGILGFLLRDIRQTVAIAKKTKCSFCNQFCGAFHSYCSECMPMDDYQRQIAANRPKLSPCDICLAPILNFSPHNIVYGDCCHKGFAHKTCMRKYDLSAGYYLRCQSPTISLRVRTSVPIQLSVPCLSRNLIALLFANTVLFLTRTCE